MGTGDEARFATFGEVTSELGAWAASHRDLGGEAVLDSMRECVPFVRRAFLAARRAQLRAEVDARATRATDPWADADVRRLMAGMRSGEPTERTAYALGRTVAAVATKASQVRSRFPRSMWEARK